MCGAALCTLVSAAAQQLFTALLARALLGKQLTARQNASVRAALAPTAGLASHSDHCAALCRPQSGHGRQRAPVAPRRCRALTEAAAQLLLVVAGLAIRAFGDPGQAQASTQAWQLVSPAGP